MSKKSDKRLLKQRLRATQAASKLDPVNIRRAKKALGFFLIPVGIYCLISLFSFHPQDSSWANNYAPIQLGNLGGLAGAWLAYTLNFLLGYASFWFIAILFISAGLLFYDKKQDMPHILIQVFGHGLMLISLCGLLSIHFSGSGMPASAGGWLGEVCTRAFVHIFGILGATLFLLALFLGSVQLLIEISWLRVMDKVGKYILQAGELSSQFISSQREQRLSQKKQEERKSLVDQGKKFIYQERSAKTRIEPSVPKLKPGKHSMQKKQIPLFMKDENFNIPSLGLLEEPEQKDTKFSEEGLSNLSKQLELKLADFGVRAEVVSVRTGPVVTLFEITLAPGTQARKVTSLEKDLARALSVPSIRVVENIPGKPYVGIEMPNENRENIALSEILNSSEYEKTRCTLPLALGKNTIGKTAIIDLQKLPHLLVAGTTGAGKSVALHAMLMSLLFKLTPQQARMILIDPKMLELSVYAGIPHLLTPVITDVKLATYALRWTVAEMEQRYRIMSGMGVRNIEMCNQKIMEARRNKQPLKDMLAEVEEGAERPEQETLPYIIVVIDEFADMIMVVGKKLEELIVRIAQKARAAGIHLLIATQRPSVDVITGLVKANIPSRVAFQVSSAIDSRTIIDQKGAEQLLGQGDMLYLASGAPVPERIHGAFVCEQEVKTVVDFLKTQGETNYLEALEGRDGEPSASNLSTAQDPFADKEDELYAQACALVHEKKNASISSLQRRMRIGYNRAARMIEKMEEQGIVSAVQSNGSREVLTPGKHA